MNRNDWFKIKKYPHIGTPLVYKNIESIKNYIKDKNKISKHGFLPFIHKVIKQKKFNKSTKADGHKEKTRTLKIKKDRDIFFASHLDSNIYSYYSDILSQAYEKELERKGLSECVTAYRRIKHLNKQRNKCNIDFANDVFNEIRSYKEKQVIAIAFDIESFFDNLNHNILKKTWRDVMKHGKSLPDDHYNVFKNITNFSYINQKDLFNEFKDIILVKRFIKGREVIIKKEVKKHSYMKEKGAVAYCYKSDMKKIRKSTFLIRNNKKNKDGSIRKKGIPQGSPISSVLANMYLLHFDYKVNSYVKKMGGIYRRYSDDMVIICNPEKEAQIIEFMKKEISCNSCLLKINEDKTQVFSFTNRDGRYFSAEKILKTGEYIKNRSFKYLGFDFDGENVLLRSSSLAKFYRAMKKSIKKHLYYSRSMKNSTNGTLFKGSLYKRFTYLGAGRRAIWIRNKNNTKFHKSEKYDWGNFLTYAQLAEKSISKNKIKHQLKNHWKIFHKLIPKDDE